MKISIVGPLFFAGRMASELGGRGHDVAVVFAKEIREARLVDALKRLLASNVVYVLYGTALRRPSLVAALRLLGKRVVVHFIGSDVLDLENASPWARRSWMLALKLSNRILAVSPALAGRLPGHLAVDYVPLNFRSVDCDFVPYPEKPTVLAYLPSSKSEFYGRSLISRLIDDNPDLHFILLGKDHDCGRPHVERMDLDYSRDMEEIYSRTTVLVRLTRHDGLSNMVLESLARGRHVIWTQTMPYCQTVSRDYDSVRSALTRIKGAGANIQAMEWVREAFNHARIVDDIENILRDPNWRPDRRSEIFSP